MCKLRMLPVCTVAEHGQRGAQARTAMLAPRDQNTVASRAAATNHSFFRHTAPVQVYLLAWVRVKLMLIVCGKVHSKCPLSNF